MHVRSLMKYCAVAPSGLIDRSQFAATIDRDSEEFRGLRDGGGKIRKVRRDRV
jgi:hypothetical protein